MAAIVCTKYMSEMHKANSRLLGNHTYVAHKDQLNSPPQEATTGGLGASPQVSGLNSSPMGDCPAPPRPLPTFGKPPLGGWGLAPSA